MCEVVMSRWNGWPPSAGGEHAKLSGRAPYGRAVSMEQRWQDLANLLSLPGPQQPGVATPHDQHAPMGPHAGLTGGLAGGLMGPQQPSLHYGYDTGASSSPARSVVLHNATLAPPAGDLNSSSVYPGLSMGNAVAQSMNLTNSSEPMGDVAPPAGYKMEPSHDMLYYQNSTSSGQEMGPLGTLNSTTEGFLSAILNDEDLQLMDMMNESMYPMRMLDTNSSNNASSLSSVSGMGVASPGGPGMAHGAGHGAATLCPSSTTLGTAEERLDASSDSAVSSMGSERVASLSDGGEWMETGSDSGHTNDHYHMDRYRSAHGAQGPAPGPGPHEYGAYLESPHRIPPVAQKKHQMFGKRYFQGEHSAGPAPPIVPHGSPAMATPMALKYEFGDAARGLGATGPIGMNGAVGPGIGIAGAGVSAFASPLDDEEAKSNELKYSCSQEFSRHLPPRPGMEQVAHNHSYHLPPPPESSGAVHRPVSRDKMRSKDARKSDDTHLTRDEKRARALSVPLAVDDIINLPMDEFNERLSKHDLSEAQLSLIRDIRRRGKNKVAAQNCRKRKLDQIVSLADEVQQMRSRKQKLLREHEYLLKETDRAKDKFSQLYRHVFQSLRDADGNAYSPYEYSLQQAPGGSVVLVPQATNSASLMEPVSHPMPGSTSHSSVHPHPHMQSERHKDQHPQQPHQHHPHHPHHPHHHSDPNHKE